MNKYTDLDVHSNSAIPHHCGLSHMYRDGTVYSTHALLGMDIYN